MPEHLRIAVVCSSNQNRSMETHNLLSKKGYCVRSYGTGSVVKLPGPGPNQPNVYSFDTTYEEMYHDLCQKDPHLCVKERARNPKYQEFRASPWCSNRHTKNQIVLRCPKYTQNGILHMLDRNKRIKPKPERFQEVVEEFDVIFTVEERIYDTVLEGIEAQGPATYSPVQIINLEIKDNHEEATLGAFLILELCEMMKEADDLENEIEDIVQEFEAKNSRTLLHTVAFY